MSYRYNQRGERVKERSSGSAIGWGIFALLVLFGLWILAPWGPIHAVALLLYKSMPLMVAFFAALISLGLVAGLFRSAGTAIAGGLILVTLVMFGGCFSSGLSDTKLAQSISPQIITELPETESVRYMPMPVALKVAQNAYQDPKNRVAEGMDPFITQSGELAWVGARVPTGMMNALTGKQPGVVTVSEVGKLNIIDQEFSCGEGMAVTDEVTWAIWRMNYLADLGEPYYAQTGDELVMVVPFITWKWDFPVTIPTWGGVFLIHGDCSIEELTPKQAQEDERLTGIRLVPEELAKIVSEAWAYREGIWNAWFIHAGQTEVPKIEGESNQMPYLMPTEAGSAWVTAFEPYGPAFSIYKLMFMDTRTGLVSMYQFPGDANIASPNRAGDYIRTSQPTFNWYGGEGQGGNMVVMEPRPLIKDGILYWMMTLTSVEHSSINATYLMRSTDQAIFMAKNLGELKAFVAGGSLQQITGESTTIPTASPAIDGSPVNANADLTQLSEQQLRELINAIFDELARR